VKITTSRFGTIDVDFSKVIEMKGPILGFERLRKFALIRHDSQSPFWWLQSAEDGTVAFVVVDPFMVKMDYEPVIGDDDIRLLEIASPADVLVLAIVTIRKEPFAATVNLRAPVIVHAAKRIAKQIVLETYPVQYALTETSPQAGTAVPRDSRQSGEGREAVSGR